MPLTRQPGGLQAWKVVIPPERGSPNFAPTRATNGSTCCPGELRLILADHDITMRPGEVAEFDTRLPHWFGSAGDQPVEILSLLGKQGERIHVRAAPRRKTGKV